VTLAASATCLAAFAAPGAVSQQTTPPAAEFRYIPDQLDCATFQERSRAQLEAQTGIRQRHETLTRDGVWRLRARPAAAGLAIEAWYDSLALSRESPEGKLVPDTDGLLGGRYRGALSPAGRYTAQARPFVPDEVAEVAELGGAMEDLLPPLPPVAIAVGQRWSDSSGLELRRLPDSVAGRRVVRRLAVHQRTEADQATVRGDTTRLPARQVTVEDGQVDWDPAIGLLRRVRRLVVETSVPAGGPLRQPLRSRLEQEGTLVRVGGKCEVNQSRGTGAGSP
jgi:hypothetical protein